VSTYADRLLLIPGLLEYGAPSHDVWPDNPEWEERQITCDFGIRVLRPGLFSDLVVRLNSAEGRRQLRIVADPLPVFLSHHAVFFAAVDQVRYSGVIGLRNTAMSVLIVFSDPALLDSAKLRNVRVRDEFPCFHLEVQHH